MLPLWKNGWGAGSIEDGFIEKTVNAGEITEATSMVGDSVNAAASVVTRPMFPSGGGC